MGKPGGKVPLSKTRKTTAKAKNIRKAMIALHKRKGSTQVVSQIIENLLERVEQVCSKIVPDIVKTIPISNPCDKIEDKERRRLQKDYES